MLRTTKQRFLKFSLLFAAIFLPFSALSQNSHSTMMRKPSWYMDFGAGVDIFNSPANSNIFGLSAAAFTDTLIQENRLINSSAVASFGIGYMFPVNRWFNLGFRAFGNYSSNSNNFSGEQFFTNSGFRFLNLTLARLRSFDYGVDFTPSVNIGANQFLTGILGIAFNGVQIQSLSILDGNSATAANLVETLMKRAVRGLRVGASLEELLSRRFGIFMSYIWTGYSSIHALQSVDAPLRFAGDSDVNLQTHHILLGLKYYFSSQHFQSSRRARMNYFNRMYLSFGLGQLIPQYVGSGGFEAIETSIPILYPNSFNQGPMVITGFLGLGYGFLIHHFYLGAEALVSAADRNSRSSFALRNSARDFDKAVRINLDTFESAFDLKFGGLVAPETLLIFKTGVAYNYLRLRDFLRYHRFANSAVMQITQNVGHEVLAPRVGVGLEKLFSDTMALRVDYIYTYYGHVSVTGGSAVAGVASLSFSQASARVASNTVTLGINYYFS